MARIRGVAENKPTATFSSGHCGFSDCSINITNLGEGRLSRRFRGHTDTVNQVCCHNGEPDVFLSCSADRTVVIWDSRQPKPASVLSKL